ncbi:SUN domain-containing ossification factor isoform X2 [Alosa pseudoharengus]|uniref:SUN domain-containing ossification factor isoform X2 n=1 Tax=Alosa pseudoharengus TaxID=34774 RepID=UPI003F8A28B9
MKRLRVLLVCLIVALLCWYPGHYVHCSVQSASGPVLSAQDGGPQATEQKEEVAYDKVEESGRTDGQSSYDVGVESERASLEDQPAGDASKEDEHKQTVNPEEQPVVVFEQQQEVEEVVLMVEEVRSEPEQPVTEPEPAADPQQAQDSLAASHTHQPEPEVHAELPPSTSTDQASASTSTSSSTTTTTSTAAAPKDPIPEPQAEPHSDAPATPEHAAEVPGGAPTSVPSPDAPSSALEVPSAAFPIESSSASECVVGIPPTGVPPSSEPLDFGSTLTSDVENMSITLGRGTGTNADLPPPLDLVVPDPDQSGNASLKPEEPQVVDSSGSRETDPSVPSKEDIPTFDEWKKKVMEVEKEKSQSLHTSSNGNPHPVKKVQKNFKNNYASVECGAKILSANSEAKSTSAILMENMDIYMLNPCSNKIWFVIELCEPIQVKQLDIANFELFSSTPKDFLVSISDRYPTNKWIKLGTFHARDQRTVQSFPLDEQLYAKYVKMFIKYMKVELLSHFGSEHFCPLSLFRVFGTSMVEEIDEADSQYPAERLEYPDEEFDDVPGYIPSEDKSSKNLLGSATNAILDIVNNIAANVLGAKPEQEGGAHIEGDASSGADNITETASEISVSPTPTPTTPPVLEVSEAEQAVPKDDQAAPLPETPAASALPEGGQIVTLVQDEEEEQSSQSTVTLLEEEEEGAEEASSSSSSSAPPETEEEQCGREAAQRESLFYCAHLSTLSCLASLQEKLCRWCSVTLALQRQRKDRQHRAAARGAASRRGSGGGGGGEESAAVSHVAPPPAQQTAVPAPTPTLAQEQPPAQPASERLPQAEPAQGERPSATDAMDVGAGHQGEAAGAAERTSDPPILLEPSRTSTLPPHSFSDGSLAKPTPTQDIPERPTGEPQDQQQQQRPGYLEQVPKTQAEGHRTSSSSPPHLHPTPTATSAGLTSTPEALSPETDSPRLDPPLDSSSQQPLLPTHTQPADIIAPPTELPAPPPPESADSGRPGVEELPHHRPLTPAPPPPPQQQQQEVPEAPAPHADHRVEEAVEELLLSVPAATGHHRTATDFYAELQNTADLPHGNGNGNLVHGSNQKESVFMRLNNRIKALEMNMSLSSRYLEELSQRYRKQMEEMQRAFNKTIIKLQNTSRIAEEQDQKQTESIQVLQNQLENVTKLMLNLSATVIQLQREVSDRQSYLVVSLVLCLLLGLLLCMQCCRGSSNHSSTSTAVPMTNHYPSPKRCFSSYDDMSLKRRVSSPLVRSKSFQMTATDVGPDDLYIVEPLRFSPEKKKKRCKVKASEKAETLKASAITAAPAPISNGAPKCNGTGGGLGGSYPHSLHFLPCPDIAELSTCSSRDAAAWSEVSSEGSSTVSDEPAFSGSASSSSATAAAAPYSSDLCNGHLPTRSKAEKRSFKRRRSKQADQQQQQQQHSWNGYRGDEDDELLPVPILEELIKGKQELGVGMGTFRVQTVTGHV